MEEAWWSRRWLEAMGQADAGLPREGLSGEEFFTVEPGSIKCKTQDGRGRNCFVKLETAVPGPGVWESAARAMASRAVFRAKLLAGQMPESLESVLKEHGLFLFPAALSEFKTTCTLHPEESFCEHRRAVICEFARRLAADPFLLLALRGRNREALLQALEKKDPAGPASVKTLPPPVSPADPKRDFWKSPAELSNLAARFREGLETGSPGWHLPGLEDPRMMAEWETFWKETRRQAGEVFQQSFELSVPSGRY